MLSATTLMAGGSSGGVDLGSAFASLNSPLVRSARPHANSMTSRPRWTSPIASAVDFVVLEREQLGELVLVAVDEVAEREQDPAALRRIDDDRQVR